MTESDYYQHYADSFKLQRSYLAKRDRLTICVIVMAFMVTLTFGDSESAEKLSANLQQENIGSVTFSFGVVNVIINFIFLWVVMNYYQINLIIERMYSYIHRLEDYLSTSDFKIDRESDNYLEHYPWMLYVSHCIYALLFPLLIFLVAFVKLLSEVDAFSKLSWLNVIMLVLIMVLTILYLSNRWFDESAFSKKTHPDWPVKYRLEHFIKNDGAKNRKVTGDRHAMR